MAESETRSTWGSLKVPLWTLINTITYLTSFFVKFLSWFRCIFPRRHRQNSLKNTESIDVSSYGARHVNKHPERWHYCQLAGYRIPYIHTKSRQLNIYAPHLKFIYAHQININSNEQFIHWTSNHTCIKWRFIENKLQIMRRINEFKITERERTFTKHFFFLIT